MKKVKIFTTQTCPYCDEAKKYLQSKSIDFEEIDLTTHQAAAASLVQKTGHTAVPQIQIDDKFIIGFDKNKIDETLKED